MSDKSSNNQPDSKSKFDFIPSITKVVQSAKDNTLHFEIRIASPKLSVGGILSDEAVSRSRLAFLTYVQSLCDAEAIALTKCLGDS